jgi:hypothetical protein
MDRNVVVSIYGWYSIKVAHFVPIHWQTWTPQVILVSDWSISKNLLLWNRFAILLWPCLLMDQNEMSNFYRGPSIDIDASYHVSYHLAKRFLRKSCFRNRPIRNKNCWWWPYLLMDHDPLTNMATTAILVSDWSISKNLLLWNCFAKWTKIWWEAPIVEMPTYRYFGRHFVFR